MFEKYQHFFPSSIGGSDDVTVFVAAGESFVTFPFPPFLFSLVTTHRLAQSSSLSFFTFASPDHLQVAIAEGNSVCVWRLVGSPHQPHFEAIYRLDALDRWRHRLVRAVIGREFHRARGSDVLLVNGIFRIDPVSARVPAEVLTGEEMKRSTHISQLNVLQSPGTSRGNFNL